MSQEHRDKLRDERSLVVNMYDTLKGTLVYVFLSKVTLYASLSIHHTTLNKCLESGVKYLHRFLFSYTVIEQYAKDRTLSLFDLNKLLIEVKGQYKVAQPASRPVFAENVMYPDLSRQFSGIGEFARTIKGDRASIRVHIDKGTLYRKEWKVTSVSNSTGDK